MKTLDFIGLDPKEVKRTVEELQQLLADLHVFYMNLRGFHWNIQGGDFFTLHEQFEEIYDEVEGQIDEVAERILTLGGVPENKFSKYLKVSKVKEIGETTGSEETVKSTLDAFKVVIAQERVVADAADDADDEVTEGMMGDFLSGHEKKVWMLVAFLQKAK